MSRGGGVGKKGKGKSRIWRNWGSGALNYHDTPLHCNIPESNWAYMSQTQILYTLYIFRYFKLWILLDLSLKAKVYTIRWQRSRDMKSIWFFAKNSYFLIPASFQPVIFQTFIILCTIIDIWKYQRSVTLGCIDIGGRKSQFVAKTQFLYIFQFLDNLVNRIYLRL